MKRFFLFSLLFLLFSSCEFNKLFLQPTKIPKTVKKIKLSAEKDTSYVAFHGEKYQPFFLDKKGDTLEKNYTIKSVIFENSEGNKLNGWLLRPENILPKITLLHFHGNAGSLIDQHRALQPLLEKGFQVFVFDYSGFGFSDGKATRKNARIDALSALDFIKMQKETEHTKLVIYGQSLGGHLSAVVAKERQNDIDGLVIEGAFSSHKDIAAEAAGFVGRIFVRERYSAVQAIQEYHKPLLVIHSTEDEIIPFELGKKIYENAHSPKEFFEIKECHICGPEFYADSIAEKIQKMLEK